MKFKQKLKTYKNGMRLVLTMTPGYYSANVAIQFSVGSEDEEIEYGISHLIEHELFKGTKNLSQSELTREFLKISARQNANTVPEFTTFKASLPKTNMERCLQLFSEMIFEPAFDEAELEKEKLVIIEEMKMDDDEAKWVGFNALESGMFSGSGLSKRILGRKSNFVKIGRGDIIAFMNERYIPENCLISVVGDFEFEKIDAIIQKLFVKRFNGASGKKKQFSKSVKNPPVLKNIYKDTKQTMGMIAFYGLPYYHKYFEHYLLMNYVLGGGSLHSRLFERIRNQLSLAYGIVSAVTAYKNNGYLLVHYSTSPENNERTRTAVLEVIGDMLKNGITDEEFEASKKMILDKFLMQQDTPTAHTLHINYEGKLFDPVVYEERIRKMKKTDCERIFREVIGNQKPFEVYVGPKGSEKSEI